MAAIQLTESQYNNIALSTEYKLNLTRLGFPPWNDLPFKGSQGTVSSGSPDQDDYVASLFQKSKRVEWK